MMIQKQKEFCNITNRLIYIESELFMMPIPIKTENYKSSSLDLNQHIPSKINLRISHLNQGTTIMDGIPLISVNTAAVPKIEIDWKITERYLKKTVTSRLKILVK
jgi:hypothetical protein